MKKILWFSLVSMGVLIVLLLCTNLSAIRDCILAIPKDNLGCYLLGGLSMLTAQWLTEKNTSSDNSN